MSSGYTMRLLKCPSCGGPIDPTSGDTSTTCPYCGSTVVIPESLRKKEPGTQSFGSVLGGMDLGAMMGAGAQWSEVVMLAQRGQKDEAVKKYMGFSNVGEAQARGVIESLSGAQMYEYAPGTSYGAVQVAPMISAYTDTARSMARFSMWLTCGIVAFVLFIIVITTLPVLIGVFASLWAAFHSF